jgi:hypothetical protein
MEHIGALRVPGGFSAEGRWRWLLNGSGVWVRRADITGFLFLDSEGYRPDPKLEDFLAKGPPPVYIG